MNEYSVRITKQKNGLRQVVAYNNGKPIFIGKLSKFSELSRGEQALLLSIEDLISEENDEGSTS